MTKAEVDFLIQHKLNFDSVRLGFTRNISFDVLGQYEQLYRKYLDAQFILTYWCGACVFDMLERLIRYCEDQEEYINAINPQTYETTKVEEVKVIKKRRTKPSK
jgi:hypothetical protein